MDFLRKAIDEHRDGIAWGHPGKALERTREVRLVGVPRRQCHLRERRVAPGYLATDKFNPEPPLVFSNAASVVQAEGLLITCLRPLDQLVFLDHKLSSFC